MQFINVYQGQFTDKEKNEVIKYNKVNVLDDDGSVLSLKVDNKVFVLEDALKIKLGDNVNLVYKPDQKGIARVTNIVKV